MICIQAIGRRIQRKVISKTIKIDCDWHLISRKHYYAFLLSIPVQNESLIVWLHFGQSHRNPVIDKYKSLKIFRMKAKPKKQTNKQTEVEKIKTQNKSKWLKFTHTFDEIVFSSYFFCFSRDSRNFLLIVVFIQKILCFYLLSCCCCFTSLYNFLKHTNTSDFRSISVFIFSLSCLTLRTWSPAVTQIPIGYFDYNLLRINSLVSFIYFIFTGLIREQLGTDVVVSSIRSFFCSSS